MQGSAQPEDRFPPVDVGIDVPRPDQPSSSNFPSKVASDVGDRSNGNGSNGSRVLAEKELDSTLQLLVERAQYITGATGAALALPQGDEMVCRASAGSSAPSVGARLQVRSGLTGESISRRQLLRCDNAESDPRVNLETCRALGIASIVVLPLLRRNGDVRGLFELFSDHPYAFEERDLIALERMAALTLTALDLAEQQQNATVSPVAEREAVKPLDLPSSASSPLPTDAVVPTSVPTVATTAAVPEAMQRVQKCGSCGFPVSEGRSLCLDCENKDSDQKDLLRKFPEKRANQVEAPIVGKQAVETPEIALDKMEPSDLAAPPVAASTTAQPEEFVPAFLANSSPVKESWMANHVNLLAIAVLILGILVAVVVFR